MSESITDGLTRVLNDLKAPKVVASNADVLPVLIDGLNKKVPVFTTVGSIRTALDRARAEGVEQGKRQVGSRMKIAIDALEAISAETLYATCSTENPWERHCHTCGVEAREAMEAIADAIFQQKEPDDG